eukprot:TRINITY_DN2689_c0_g1_i1.p1 TRINITY_DN2689_c0_g1~~TRINITY_DN2689_c0_g1_i1.p1  ORF type:complete len:1286 (+),score=243.35 TRINITY_DN2689_c0_g1_i1:11413-15270(+)
MDTKEYYADYPQISRIEWLHLHNFKSFKGDHRIGPFLNLTAIIGPNGGGKSNLLDAVCFVLLTRTSQTRESNLKQFIHKSPDSGPSKAWVEMQFCDKEGRTSIFRRVVHPKGHCIYYLDGEAIPRDKYVEELESREVIKRTRSYCAIMQGEIDSILQNSSKEIVKIIEDLSGSAKFKGKYEELRAKMEQTQNQITAVSKTIQELRKEKRKAKGLKTNVEAFEKSRERLAQFQQEFYVATCAFYEIKAKELIGVVGELQEKIRLQADIKDSDIERLHELGTEMSEMDRENTDKEREKERLKMARAQCEKTIKTIEAKIDAIKKEKSDKKTILAALESSFEGDIAKRKEIENEKKQLTVEHEKLMDEIKKVEEKSQVGDGYSQQEEYYKIKNEVVAKSFDMQSELKRLLGYKEGYVQRMVALNEIIEKLNYQLKALKIEGSQIDLKKAEREIKKKKEEQKEWAEKYSTSIENQKQHISRTNDLEMQLTVGEYELKRLEQEHEFKVLRGREYHMIEQLKTKVRGCRGLMIQLITACEKKYDTAVKFGLGKYLTHLVVDDESAAASCNIFLKDAGVMKDILILANIPRSAYLTPSTSTIPPEACVPGSVRLIDAIEYNANIKRLKEAILFIAGKKVICENLQSARKLRSHGYKELITLNGEILKQGVIAGGSNEALMGLELHHAGHAEKIEDVKKDVEQIRAELETLRRSGLAEEIRENKGKLEMIGTTIGELESYVMNARQRLEILQKHSEETEKKLEDMEKERNELKSSIEKTEEEITDLRTEVSELEEKMFAEFCKRWHIMDIQEYEGTNLAEANAFLAKKSEVLRKIEQCNAQIELLKAGRLKDKIEKIEEDISSIDDLLNELLAKLLNEQKKSRSIEEAYSDLAEEFVDIEAKKAEIIDKQKALKEEIVRSNEAIDELKKELITSICQVKSNAHMKLRTVDEAKLKNIPIAMELVTNPRELLTQGMEADYKIDYYKYDIDPLITTSKDLDLKAKTLLDCISEEEKRLNEFNTLALMKEEGEELEDLDKEIEEHRKNLEQYSKEHEMNEREYRKVRESRRQAFKACYDLLSTYVDGIYQELTKTEETGFAYGGHAILVPENVGEPYNGEIQYVPTPPGKRVVYELDQLSGGEKALATLALVLAIQKYQQSPILILDEVDAHLDIKNVARLGAVLASGNGESAFQCIVVSHKETLAALFHGVIGVTISKPALSSKALSLDLRTQLIVHFTFNHRVMNGIIRLISSPKQMIGEQQQDLHQIFSVPQAVMVVYPVEDLSQQLLCHLCY